MSKNKKVSIEFDTVDKIARAVQDVLDGVCSKVIISDDVKVYQCTNVVRIDLRIKEDT